jgi:hypothetical protein
MIIPSQTGAEQAGIKVPLDLSSTTHTMQDVYGG